MQNHMLKRKEYLEAEITRCKKLLKSAPKGKLEIYKNNKSTKYYIKYPGKVRIYLSKKEKATAAKLALKRVTEDRIQSLKQELEAVNYYLASGSENETLTNFSDFLFLAGQISAVKDAWAKEDYEKNTSHSESLKHPSPSGNILRSKSECLIDMELFYRNIPYRYECRLDFENGYIFPDFTFYKPSTNEYMYWEHFGMMDDLHYRLTAMEKLEKYMDNGIYPDDKLICTFETGSNPLTTSTIASAIDKIELWLNS